MKTYLFLIPFLIAAFFSNCENDTSGPAQSQKIEMSLTVAEQTVNENCGSVTYTITLAQPAGKTIEIPFTISGTAQLGSDFTVSDQMTTVATGITVATVIIPIVDDVEVEAAETIILTLHTTDAVTTGMNDSTAVVTIVSDDVPVFSVHPETFEIDEPAGETVIIGELSASYPAQLKIPFTLSGTTVVDEDYTLSGSSFNFVTGQTVCTLSVHVVDDSEAEDTETLILNFSPKTTGVSYRDTMLTLFVQSDDQSVSLSFLERGVYEGCGQLNLIATTLLPPDADLTIPFTLAGSCESGNDYVADEAVFTFAPGRKQCTTTVTIVNDTEVEEAETLQVTLSPPAGIALGDTSELNIIVYSDDGDEHQIQKCIIINDDLEGWEQSPYESDLVATKGDELYGIINGGAQPYIENGYGNGFKQTINGPEETSLSFMAMNFLTVEKCDALFTVKVAGISELVEIPGFSTDVVAGFPVLNGITVYSKIGRYYFELVLSGYSSQDAAAQMAKTFIDLFSSRLTD